MSDETTPDAPARPAVAAAYDAAAPAVAPAAEPADADDAVAALFADEDGDDAAVDAEPLSRASFSLLRDVDMEVTVELGRTHMQLRDLLSVVPGTIIELDRAVSTPVDVLANGTPIARGKVVVIDDEYAVRITEIITDA